MARISPVSDDEGGARATASGAAARRADGGAARSRAAAAPGGARPKTLVDLVDERKARVMARGRAAGKGPPAGSGKSKGSDDDGDDEVDEDTAWNLVNDSGVLERLESAERRLTRPTALQLALAALLFTAPLLALHCGLEVLVHQQFSEDQPFLSVLANRGPRVFPALYVLVLLVHYFAEREVVQYGMAVGATALGARMLYLTLGTHTYGVMLTVPGIAVAWIYFIAQMRLSLALASLLGVGAYMAYYRYTENTEYPGF